MWGVCLLVVVFERDLGSAVLFYTIFLLMLYVATGRFSYVVIGLALLAVGAVVAYKFLSHVQVRIHSLEPEIVVPIKIGSISRMMPIMPKVYL